MSLNVLMVHVLMQAAQNPGGQPRSPGSTGIDPAAAPTGPSHASAMTPANSTLAAAEVMLGLTSGSLPQAQGASTRTVQQGSQTPGGQEGDRHSPQLMGGGATGASTKRQRST